MSSSWLGRGGGRTLSLWVSTAGQGHSGSRNMAGSIPHRESQPWASGCAQSSAPRAGDEGGKQSEQLPAGEQQQRVLPASPPRAGTAAAYDPVCRKTIWESSKGEEKDS